MTRPDEIVFKGKYIATHLTEHEKDIWELGQVAGASWALNSLRDKVEALEEHIVEHGDLYVRRNDVLGLIDGPVS